MIKKCGALGVINFDVNTAPEGKKKDDTFRLETRIQVLQDWKA